MSISHEDLVAYALGGLPAEESGRVAAALAADPALARELKEIERHMRLHDAAPRIEPDPQIWASIRSRLDEPAAPRSLLHRFMLPLAAAALMALAFVWPQGAGQRLLPTYGDVVETTPGFFEARSVARMMTTDGIVLTLDTGTNVRLISETRLALGAGRVFLEVPPERSGFSVVAGDLVAVTTGTTFLVERGEHTFVWTESGHVRCSWRDREAIAGPGEAFFASTTPPPPLPPSPRAWFRRPSLDAEMLDGSMIRVTLRNDMPDPIDVAPSKSGEPLFFASYLRHDYPLTPDDFRPFALQRGASRVFELRLPRPVPDGEALSVSYAPGGVRAEVGR